jgi:hypothetical protein
MRKEPEGMFRNHNKSSAGLWITSRTILGGSSEGIWHSVEFLEAAQVKAMSFEHCSTKEISLKLSEPWFSD